MSTSLSLTRWRRGHGPDVRRAARRRSRRPVVLVLVGLLGGSLGLVSPVVTATPAAAAALHVVSTEFVSLGADGSLGTTGDPYDANASADGRYVAFVSDEDLVPGDSGVDDDVFVRDRLGRTTVMVSVTSSGEQGNDRSGEPEISGDGRFVAFSSVATNLTPEDRHSFDDIFVHDRDADVDGVFDEPGGITTTLMSRAASVGAGADLDTPERAWGRRLRRCRPRVWFSCR